MELRRVTPITGSNRIAVRQPDDFQTVFHRQERNCDTDRIIAGIRQREKRKIPFFTIQRQSEPLPLGNSKDY